MNDNLDDWLNSIGVPIDPDVRETVPAVQDEEPASPEPNQPQSLTENDFDDILGEFGFTRPEDAQAEEIHDGNDDEGIEDEEEEGINDEWQQMEASPQLNDAFNRIRDAIQRQINATEEPRDLDAEEDADWQEAIDSGSVVSVGNGIMDQIIAVEEAAQEPRTLTLSDIENALREMAHNEEVVDVPIVREESPNEQQEPPVHSEEPFIPLNSPTLLLDESTTRFSGAEWFNEIQKKSIIFGGIGGIGSNCCFQLARMHPAAIFMYDDDNVETVNMAGQLYSRNDVGRSKVSAISDMIASYTNMQNVFALNQRFTSNTEAGDIMMCGFDNMLARKIFFSKWLDHVEEKPLEEQKKCLFLDGRLSMDTLQVLCIVGDDRFNINRYRSEFLFSDDEAEHTVCSMKQTTYLACMIGSIMVNLFTNWCANLLDPIIPYDLPFFTEYDAQNMIFKTVK